MFNTLKKAIFGNSAQQEDLQKENKIDKVSSLLNGWFSSISKELFVTRFKLKNLATANHKLGFKHLKSGNISDATFRFKFIKKFWPQDYDARYALAYCLALRNDFTAARAELTQLQNESFSYSDKIALILAAISFAESNQQKIEFDLGSVIDTDHELEIILDEEEKKDEVKDDEILGQEQTEEEKEKSDEESFKKIVKILNEDEK